MKVLNFIFAALFLLFAFVQINDPDPILWIIIYGAMTTLAIMAMFNKFPKYVILGLMILFIAYSTYFLPGVLEWLQTENKSELFDDVAKMNHLYIEESREFLGLWICILVLIYYFRKARKATAS